jgi:hypothetical protein
MDYVDLECMLQEKMRELNVSRAAVGDPPIGSGKPSKKSKSKDKGAGAGGGGGREGAGTAGSIGDAEKVVTSGRGGDEGGDPSAEEYAR